MGEMTFPPELENWIASRVAEGRYADEADYLRDLVRRDQDAADVEWLREKIAVSIASPLLDENPREVIESIIAEIPAQDA